jgi:hypothetical protein
MLEPLNTYLLLPAAMPAQLNYFNIKLKSS